MACDNDDTRRHATKHLRNVTLTLEDMTRRGLVERFTGPNGETRYRLTEQGKHYDGDKGDNQ